MKNYTMTDMRKFIDAKLRQKSSKTDKLVKINTFHMRQADLKNLIQDTQSWEEFERYLAGETNQDNKLIDDSIDLGSYTKSYGLGKVSSSDKSLNWYVYLKLEDGSECDVFYEGLSKKSVLKDVVVSFDNIETIKIQEN